MGIVFGKTGVAEPSFDILLSRSSTSTPLIYEIRRYGQRFAIETEYSRDRDGDGFMALAGYIGVGTKPQNDGAVSVAMTAPVVTDSKPSTSTSTSAGGRAIAMTAPVVTNNNNKSKKMQFILPEEYDEIHKIPKPTNQRVNVVQVPAATGAVHRFNGSMTDAKAEARAAAFARQLIDDGVDTTEEEVLRNYELWQFHPPFTLGPLRRNEIWVNLTQTQVDALLKKYKEEKENV